MKARSTRLFSMVAVVGVVVLSVDVAEAQQRRRAPRRPPASEPSAEVPETPPPTPAPNEPAPAPAESPAATPAIPEATSEAPEQATAEPEAVPDSGPDLAPLRQEYAAIMDELVNARARVAIVGKALFKTKLRIILQNRAGDAQSLERVVLRLDGAPIYRKDDGAGLDEGAQVFEGFATPGPHALDLEAQQRSREGEGFGYTLRETFRVAVKKDRLTEITIVLDDDSDMGEDFPEDGEGEYDLRTRVSAATYDLEAR